MKPAEDYATRFIEDILTFFGLNVSVTTEQEEGVLTIDIPSTHLNGFLIGQRGENLRSLQHLVNMALRRNGFEDTVVTLDVASYRKQRNHRLAQRVQKLARTVLETGEPHELRPMSAYERRVVHQAIGEVEGVETESVGEGRDRKVIIKKTI